MKVEAALDELHSLKVSITKGENKAVFSTSFPSLKLLFEKLNFILVTHLQTKSKYTETNGL